MSTSICMHVSVCEAVPDEACRVLHPHVVHVHPHVVHVHPHVVHVHQHVVHVHPHVVHPHPHVVHVHPYVFLQAYVSTLASHVGVPHS